MRIDAPLITGSLSYNGTSLQDLSTYATTSSVNNLVQKTGSYALTGSNYFSGSQVVSGSITATGNITAQTLIIQTITSSVLFTTGSNIIGSSLSNVQQLTGSVGITGSLSVNTNGTEFQVSAGGVNIGNALTDNHVISGSIIINPNGLFVSSSGAVGIGTTSPSTKLHVYEVLTNSSAYLTVQNNRARNAAVFTQTTNGGFYAGTSIGTDTFNYQIYDAVAGAARLTIASTGAATLSIASGIYTALNATSPNTSVYYQLTPTGGDSYILGAGVAQTNDFCIYNSTRSTNYLTILGGASGGKIGIGTTNPLTKLHVVGGDASSSNRIRLSHSTGTAEINLYTEPSGLSGVISSNAFFIETAANERMRITAGGFTKISNTGTYNDATAAYHEISSSTTNNNVLILRNTSASPYGPYFNFSSASPNNGVNYFLDCSDSTTIRLQLRSNGGLANYAANDVNLSDIRTKKDIIPLGSYWDKFKAIEIVKFKYKDQNHDDYNIGVISQQVEEVAPEFVDIDGFGTTPEDGIPLKSIYTADLYHATIKVLQEAMIKIETLEEEIEILKNK